MCDVVATFIETWFPSLRCLGMKLCEYKLLYAPECFLREKDLLIPYGTMSIPGHTTSVLKPQNA